MLNVTEKAATLLKVAKSAEGSPNAGIRIRRGASLGRAGTISVGFSISEEPEVGDAELERDGLRIFVEDSLIEPLDGRTLDVRDDDKGLALVFQ